MEKKEKPRLYRPGKPAKKRITRFLGYDTETSGNNQIFDCGSFSLPGSDDKTFKQFFTRNEVIEFLKSKKCRNIWIGAHNLGFDFFATFPGSSGAQWRTIFSKGGGLMCAYSYVNKGEFSREPDPKHYHKVTFIDTMNYAQMSLKEIGKIIGIKKFDWNFSMDKVNSKEDYERFLEYNRQDSLIARKFMEYLSEAFFSLGSNIKLTIASTAEKIFRNKYLDRIYEQQPKDQMDFIFKGYYGGRVEVFRRGMIKSKRNYYDFNSLYPSVMKMNDFPDPNSAHDIKEGNIDIINDFDGVSEIDIEVPEMHRCPLPYRTQDKKCLFPYGLLHGVWCNVEIRRAIKAGCQIKSIGRSIYYTKKCNPFSKFVTELYNLRMSYKKDKSPMEFAIKIVMNSLYGKLGMRYDDRIEYVHESVVTEDMMISNDFERQGEWFLFSKNVNPAIFCFPIWSSHVTAYGRIKLYDSIIDQDSDMCDTDSSITSIDMPYSMNLGEMKKEFDFTEGILIRPKMYGMNLDHLKDGNKEHDVKIDGKSVKCKGMNSNMSYYKFKELTENGKLLRIKLLHFTKFKESLRTGKLINSINEEFEKIFSLEDDKRLWPAVFDPSGFQESKSIRIIEGMSEKVYYETIGKAEAFRIKQRDKELKMHYASDIVDNKSLSFGSWKNDINEK